MPTPCWQVASRVSVIAFSSATLFTFSVTSSAVNTQRNFYTVEIEISNPVTANQCSILDALDVTFDVRNVNPSF